MAKMVMDHKQVLEQLANLVTDEENCAAQIYLDPKQVEEKKTALEIERKRTSEPFNVLVIGAFSSGKSTMINALIGEDLLPTGFLPETAVLGELHYGEQKRITLYPKKGRWEGGDAPFDLKETTSEEIAKYVSLSADDAINAMEEGSEKRIDAVFEKMVVHWPLEILKDGVILIDSPGINDPYSSDYIVNSYLPRADAIIYVMDAQHAYQKTDKDQLTTINDMGRENIITGYTFYDIVTRQNARKPEALEKLNKALYVHAGKHSNLGQTAVHFLSSIDALEAKQNGDEKLLRKSGFEGLENYLGQYLVEGKGRDQVRNMASTIVIQADGMIKDANALNQAASQNADDLKKKAERAQAELDTVRTHSQQTGRAFRRLLKKTAQNTRPMVENFVMTLPDDIDLEGFEPETTLPTGWGNLNPFDAKKRAKAIQEECQYEVQKQMNAKMTRWSQNTLLPHLQKAVKESVEDVRPNLDMVAQELKDVAGIVIGSGGKNGTFGDIATGLAYAILTGDWLTGGVSAIYGKGAMIKGVAFQFGAGVLLGIAGALGAPISLPVLAIASVAAAILAIITGNSDRKVERIKKQVVKTIREQHQADSNVDNRIATVDSIMENINSFMDSACSDMDCALAADIKKTEDMINQVLEESKLGQAEKQRQIDARKAAIQKLETVKADALGICAKYEINDLRTK